MLGNAVIYTTSAVSHNPFLSLEMMESHDMTYPLPSSGTLVRSAGGQSLQSTSR